MNHKQSNLVFGFFMGMLVTANVAGLILYPDITTLLDKAATAGRILVLLLMMIAMALFWVASEDV